MNKVYTEDIKAALKLAKQMPTSVVSNLFRFNENQTKAVEVSRTGRFNSINAKHNKGTRRSNISMTPRMVEVAATLNYMGYTHQNIADVFECDTTTVSKKLNSYYGYVGCYRVNA